MNQIQIKKLKKFGDLVAHRRKVLRKSQGEIGKFIGVTQSQISKTELGLSISHMSYDKVLKMCEILGIEEDKYCRLFNQIPEDIKKQIRKIGYNKTREALGMEVKE